MKRNTASKGQILNREEEWDTGIPLPNFPLPHLAKEYVQHHH